jgi:hypothetical protein
MWLAYMSQNMGYAYLKLFGFVLGGVLLLTVAIVAARRRSRTRSRTRV